MLLENMLNACYRKLEFSSLVGRGDGRITARRGTITGVGIVGKERVER